ncbi:MAG: rRNA maturation RNase YbeY [bacterium]|nr:rRNA maturation RNase YbeY [bacterium]
MSRLSIKNLTRHRVPRLPYASAARAVLPGWELSLVFVGSARARSLNRKLRGKDYVPNVLSYQAGQRSGEIIICMSEAAIQAPEYGMRRGVFILYLFIHGLLHLKGVAHGATMERRERALVARLVASPSKLARLSTTHGQETHRYRHRHRDIPGQAGRRRRSR